MRYWARMKRAFSDVGTLEQAARTANRMLDERDMNVLLADFEWKPGEKREDFVFVFARRERAADVRAVIQPLLEARPAARDSGGGRRAE